MFSVPLLHSKAVQLFMYYALEFESLIQIQWVLLPYTIVSITKEFPLGHLCKSLQMARIRSRICEDYEL
jgi:hypothetical protein